MSIEQYQLLNLLADRVGIKTAVELENFKKLTKCKDNEQLIKRLALYVGSGVTYNDMLEHKKLYENL